MQRAWIEDQDEELWHKGSVDELAKWRKLAGGAIVPDVHSQEPVKVMPVDEIPLAHGSFENDIAVVGWTMGRIRGDVLLKRFRV